jgi:hypothetical protein
LRAGNQPAPQKAAGQHHGKEVPNKNCFPGPFNISVVQILKQGPVKLL